MAFARRESVDGGDELHMKPVERNSGDHSASDKLLGYLNFSSGATDPATMQNLNAVFAACDEENRSQPLWELVFSYLETRLGELDGTTDVFRDTKQARGVLAAVRNVLLRYLEFHHDLLFHRSPDQLCNSFFVGRVMEAVLNDGSDWNDEALPDRVLKRLNDYIGHRPIAALESRQIEPYRHEFTRPMPIYIQGAGCAYGDCHEVVELALSILRDTPEEILEAAYFDMESMEELSVDTRAYDFEHPVNRRPNYHFGQWDPHHLNSAGQYNRFVVQSVTLEALMARIDDPELEDIPHEEMKFEAAAVLAGTILMASGISGRAPGTHDSSVSLAELLPEIARFRDGFYRALVQQVAARSEEHLTRLIEEANIRQQPFGGARQHLNAQLARLRASQLEHVQLARIFARMGYFEEAEKQANVVPVTSARLLCRIDCLLTSGIQQLKRGELDAAMATATDVVGLIKRAIDCGATIDPWNILGFDANFSVFPALENSFHDQRADDLVELMDQLFSFYSRMWSEAAAVDNQEAGSRIDLEFQSIAKWWHQFAVHEVSAVDAGNALEVHQAARHVAEALNVWHRGGAAAGDVRFWAQHADLFATPQSHALVIAALLDREDFVAAMALLIHWLSNENIPLHQGEHSFYELTQRWITEFRKSKLESVQGEQWKEHWSTYQKFLDYLEANAGEYWDAPQFQGTDDREGKLNLDDLFHGDGDSEFDEDPYRAAYDEMTYRDSTDDGVESSIDDGMGGDSSHSNEELMREADRIADRLDFISCIGGLWKTAVVLRKGEAERQEDSEGSDWPERLKHYASRVDVLAEQLNDLIEQIRTYRLPTPKNTNDLSDFDGYFVLESLIERVISCCVDVADVKRFVYASLSDQVTPDELEEWLGSEDECQVVKVFSAILNNDASRVADSWQDMLDALHEQPLLYVPYAKRGEPREIVRCRARQRAIQDLLVALPRLGLLLETCQLVETARGMERLNPVGPGAVTEFDELFKIGYKSIVEALIHSARRWHNEEDDSPQDSCLVGFLEQITELLSVSWLAHSRTLRLSVLERVSGERAWEKFVDFIKSYGDEIFTQRFLSMGNLRAILHQGVDDWLTSICDEPEWEEDYQLCRDLDDTIPKRVAAQHLSLVIEAVVENYGEYRDYNSTTTQSDQGGLIYTLLDFLRLRIQYDRVCWNLKPVILAHELLVRSGKNRAALLWRQALAERIEEKALEFRTDLKKLQTKYAMRMPTVADRIAERFIRPMVVDRIRALVKPAVSADKSIAEDAFDTLLEEIEELTKEPSGVGLDVPAWIMALSDEVERVLHPRGDVEDQTLLLQILPRVDLTVESVEEQIDEWGRKS